MGETVRAVANSVRGVKGRPEEFTLMQEYVDDFSNKIGSADKITQRIIREQRGRRWRGGRGRGWGRWRWWFNE